MRRPCLSLSWQNEEIKRLLVVWENREMPVLKRMRKCLYGFTDMKKRRRRLPYQMRPERSKQQ